MAAAQEGPGPEGPRYIAHMPIGLAADCIFKGYNILFIICTNLDNLFDEPGHSLQFALGDVVFQSIQEDVVVWLWEVNSREQIRDNAVEEGHVLG